ncbi:MAG: NAD(P)-dependent oxidoreductase [Verrucomicrobiota bacterium]|jgi:nucleoside-diphosphate-sugar epimerase
MTTPASLFSLPHVFEDEAQLDDVLSRPRPQLVEFIRQVRSPLLILGAGGKMGPTLAALACRAAATAGHKLRVIAVSRFSKAAAREWLEARGVETISCDLFDREAVAGLPEAADILYLVGVKFGTSQNPSLTWAANTIIPTNVAGRFPEARIVALSTGNVYPMVPIASGGATETDPLTPLGEYANAAVARERLFEFHSRQRGTPMVLVRLNYAFDLRYGVLHDLAQSVGSGAAVDLTTGYFNCIWQGDANDCIVRSLGLAASPPLALNLTGPDVLSVRAVATRLAELMGRSVKFTGLESGLALLNNPARACKLLGAPPTPLEDALRWTAHWVMRGGASLNKPTHFAERDGKY